MRHYRFALFATVALGLAVSAWAAPPCDGIPYLIYCQGFDGTGNAYASQNDTDSFGNYATVYDNFTVSSGLGISSIHWVGEYFNPPNQGPITAWTVTIWNDNAGQPRTVLYNSYHSGNDGETFLGNFGGFPTYIYGYFPPHWWVNWGTQYWLSVVPDLGFPPQWGWSSGTGGDGIAYQDFFGVRSQLQADMAFALGSFMFDEPAEPGTLLLVGTGAVAAAGAYCADVLGISTFGLLRPWRRKRF